MDSIAKILNHLLVFAFLLDIMLFFCSFNVVFMPLLSSSSFNTIFISILLLIQSVVVWLILNNHRISVSSCLSPTEFKIGMAFGLCIGAAILSFMVSHAFSRPDALCSAFSAAAESQEHGSSHLVLLRRFLGDEDVIDNSTISAANSTKSNTSSVTTPVSASTSPSLATTPGGNEQHGDGDHATSMLYSMCLEHRGTMIAVWFWSGLSFWCNFVCCLLLWVGQGELANAAPYENLSMDDFEDHFRRQQVSSSAGGGPAFVGDYATVPEIRPDVNNQHQPSGGSSSTSGINRPATGVGGYGVSSSTGYSDTPAIITTV